VIPWVLLTVLPPPESGFAVIVIVPDFCCPAGTFGFCAATSVTL
jgi:hypothetical protein